MLDLQGLGKEGDEMFLTPLIPGTKASLAKDTESPTHAGLPVPGTVLLENLTHVCWTYKENQQALRTELI